MSAERTRYASGGQRGATVNAVPFSCSSRGLPREPLVSRVRTCCGQPFVSFSTCGAGLVQC